MDFANFEEFSRAVDRLYDSPVKNTEDIRELCKSTHALRERSHGLREAATLLANAIQRDHDVIMAHEHRLDRVEISVEAILEYLRRHREGHSPQ